MENFVKQLTAYGVTHPDFQPILKKYGIVRDATRRRACRAEN